MKCKIRVSFFAILMLSALIYAMPDYFPILLISVMIHELGHIFMAFLMGVRIREMRLEVLGALIDLNGSLYSYKKEIIICIGGPLVNALTSLFAYMIFSPSETLTLFLASSISLGFLNILPIKDFDGGRICLALLNIFLNTTTAEKIVKISSLIFIISIWMISIYFLLKVHASLTLFVFSLSFFSKIFLSNATQG